MKRVILSFFLINIFCAYSSLAQINQLWEYTFGTTTEDPEVGRATAVDGLGNVYVTGHFGAPGMQTTLDFDRKSGLRELTSNGDDDIFIAKYGPTGSLEWAHAFGNQFKDAGCDIKVDHEGNVLVAGYFWDEVDFDPGENEHMAAIGSNNDAFVAKYSPEGALIWVKSFTGSDDILASTLLVDDMNNVYVSGSYGSSINCDPGLTDHMLTAAGFVETYVIKLAKTGEFVWGATTESSKTSFDGHCYPEKLTADDEGNLLLIGNFNTTVDLDFTAGVSSHTTVGGRDVFMVKYNKDGGMLWSRRFGDTKNDYAHDVVLNRNNEIYLVGGFSDQCDFSTDGNPQLLYNYGTSWQYDAYLAKYSADGLLHWVRQMGGVDYDEAHALDIDSEGHLYVVGEFRGTADFDPTGGVSEMSSDNSGYSDVFIAKFDTLGDLVEVDRSGGYWDDVGHDIIMNGDDEFFITGAGSKMSILIGKYAAGPCGGFLALGEVLKEISCHDSIDGSIRAITTGGAVPLSYSLDGVQYQQEPVFNDLAAGDFRITVRDDQGCIVGTGHILLKDPEPISLDPLVKNISCNQDNTGEIEARASGGTGALLFSLNGSGYGTDSIFSDLEIGHYLISVKDTHECEIRSDSLEIKTTSPLSIVDIHLTHPACKGADDGAVAVELTGGAAPYLYSVDNQVYFEDSVVGGLPAGFYTLYVMDVNDCMTSTEFSIAEGASIAVSINVEQEISCFEYTDGAVSAMASGGTGPLRYSLDSVNYSDDATFESLGEGSYSVHVKDSLGCSVSSGAATLEAPPQLKVMATQQPISCYDGSGAAITYEASGGTGPYTYALNGSEFMQDVQFSGLEDGKYVVKVMDKNSCFAHSDSIDVRLPVPFSIDQVIVSNITCVDKTDGSLEVQVNGGTAGYTYYLYDDQLSLLELNDEGSFRDLPAGDFTIRVEDGVLCALERAVKVKSPFAMHVEGGIAHEVSCHGLSDGMITVNASGGTGRLYFSLNGVDYSPTGYFDQIPSGIYTIFARDTFGCSAQSGEIVLDDPATLVLTDTVVMAPNSENGGVILVTASGGTGTLSYQIDNDLPSEEGAFHDLDPGSHTVSIQDVNGCKLEFDVTVPVPVITGLTDRSHSPIGLYPNPSDGFLKIRGAGKGSKLSLINQYGQLVLSDVNIAESGLIDLSKYPSGLYFVHVNNKGRVGVVKLILN